MQNAVFNITERTEKGKKVRMKGEVPAIMYGQSLEKPIPCQITKRELIDLLESQLSFIIKIKWQSWKLCIKRSAKGRIWKHSTFRFPIR